jgi:hypothetical protein
MSDRIQNNRMSSTQSRRVLVVANEVLASATVCTLIKRIAGSATVMIVAPALNGRLAFWASADSHARRDAEERLETCLALLRGDRIAAVGRVGDANPVLAVEDALRLFPADEIIVATHPETRSNWLAHNIARRVRERSGQPVHHVVVDSSLGREYVAA